MDSINETIDTFNIVITDKDTFEPDEYYNILRELFNELNTFSEWDEIIEIQRNLEFNEFKTSLMNDFKHLVNNLTIYRDFIYNLNGRSKDKDILSMMNKDKTILKSIINNDFLYILIDNGYILDISKNDSLVKETLELKEDLTVKDLKIHMMLISCLNKNFPSGMTILCIMKIISMNGDNRIIPKNAAILSKRYFIKSEKLFIYYRG